ncbi:MAG TPA: hypothetical protein VMD55_04755, partial [Terracidiphilus sp.]|nr:hypothetical protein [Terracidiphilus sp.]
MVWLEPLEDVLVREKSAGELAPVVVAVTVYGPPAVEFAVKADEVASPFALVVSISVAIPLLKVPLAPEAGAVKVTEAPLSGEPLDVTSATRGLAKLVLTVALCPDPLEAEMAITAVAVLVRAKDAGAAAPEVVAVTVYGPPAVAFALNADEVASPLALVVSVSVAVPLLNVPLAPEAGAVKVTEAPLSGEPLDVTSAT